VLFESADTEQLFAYPIPKTQVLLAKISGLVVENWIVSLIFALPFTGVYAWYVHPGVVFYLFAVLCVLIMPLIPLCVIALISYAVSALTSGSQLKSYLNILLTIILVAGIVVGVNVAARNLANVATPGSVAALTQSVMGSLKHWYPPIGYAVSALYHGSIVDMLIALAWNILPFAVLCWVLSAFYVSLRSRVVAVKKPAHGKITYGASSHLGALVKKEFARFFASPMYILNSCVGLILLTVFSIMLGHMGKNMTVLLDMMKSAGVGPVQIALILFLIILSITNTTAPSISLEGKNLWIVKSGPVSPRDVLMAKLLVHVCALAPLVIIDSVIAMFTLKLSAGDFVIVLLASLLFIVLSGLTGLVYNLHFHRFDFTNDMQVVKNSASVLLTMLTMMLVVVAALFAYWGVGRLTTVNIYVYAPVVMVVFAVAIVALYRYLGTKGSELFVQLDEEN